MAGIADQGILILKKTTFIPLHKLSRLMMKSYQIHLFEILMNESGSQNESLISDYQKLSEELLDPQKISSRGIFESLDFLTSSMTANPKVIEPLLRRKMLPYLFFLVCNN